MADRKAVMVQQTSQLADLRAVVIKSARPGQTRSNQTRKTVYTYSPNIELDEHAIVFVCSSPILHEIEEMLLFHTCND